MAEKSGKKRKKRKSNIVFDWLAYVALRIAVAILYCFPVRTNLRFACFLGRMLWRHYDRGRWRAMENLRAAYPGKDESWYGQIGQRSFEQLVMLVIDVLFAPRLVKRDTWDRYSTYHNIEKVKWQMQAGQGFIFVTGHYANFEIVGYLMGLFGFEVYSIARPLDNRFINRWLYGVRQRVGQKIIDKKGATEKMEQIMRRHATLCFIADQDAGKKGVFVDFFGRKASSYKSIALLAMQYNMPIGVGFSRRRGNDFFFEIGIQRIIWPGEWQDKDDPLTWITQEYTRSIEDFIRVDPSQYWWLHRRWKTRPREERKALEKDGREHG
ncbi:MAG: lysophospholipid acyltransferase family protein [Sedimentisphaerales bacterium]|nr:lysophospholipid acyltransferase family protein [Sedimentisphaerales bacterium]